jgi:hypothetical protein
VQAVFVELVVVETHPASVARGCPARTPNRPV